MSLRSLCAAALRHLPPAVERRVPHAVRADLRRRVGLYAPGDIGYAPVPPPPRPGSVAAAPDVVVLAGSEAVGRWWFESIADHPRVDAPPSTDDTARYFSSFCTRRFGIPEAERFRAFFARPEGAIAAYWCPDGLAYPWVTVRLSEAAPEARVVVVLSDPGASVLDALARTSVERASHVDSYLSDAAERGRYAGQLRRLSEWFDGERILILQAEGCTTDAATELARVDGFLGLDALMRTAPPRTPPILPQVDRLGAATAARLRDLYADDLSELCGLVPDLDMSLWSTAAP